jgi:hypothetical protein
MDLLTATEAAALAGVSDRTLRKYVRMGRLTRVFDDAGRACYHHAELAALGTGSGTLIPEAERAGTGPGRRWTGSGTVIVRKRSTPEAESAHRNGLNGPRHALSPPTTGIDTGEVDRLRQSLAHALAERDRADQERERVIHDMEFLRQQLEQRAEELRRRDVAESELRRLMAALTESNRMLTGMIEQKALLSASMTPEPPIREKVRWWQLWRRG